MPGKRILLVDDEPNIRIVLGAVLRSRGFEVDVAEDGFAALRLMRAHVPDLVISDLRMPNMSGFELLAVVRDKFPQLPVIAISGEFVSQQIEGVLADIFLQKGNYSPEFLIARAEELLENPHQLKRLRKSDSAVWAPLGDQPVMLTCSECFKSFPLDPCDELNRSVNDVNCIFCGTPLKYRLVGITKAAS